MRSTSWSKREHVELRADRRDLDRDVVDGRLGQDVEDPAQAVLGLVLAEDGLAEDVDVEADALPAPAGDVAGQPATRRPGRMTPGHLGAHPLPDGRDHHARAAGGRGGRRPARARRSRRPRAARPSPDRLDQVRLSTSAARAGSRMRSTSSVRARISSSPPGLASMRPMRAARARSDRPRWSAASVHRSAASARRRRAGRQPSLRAGRCLERPSVAPPAGPGRGGPEEAAGSAACRNRRSPPPRTPSGPWRPGVAGADLEPEGERGPSRRRSSATSTRACSRPAQRGHRQSISVCTSWTS